jgi:autotransporter-associated beta strand protein
MAGYYSVWRFWRTTFAILLATASSAQVALAQYTWVQATTSPVNWSDIARWTDGGTNTTFPNAVGATVLMNNPTRTGTATLNIALPATDVTVGQIKIDNTGFGDTFSTRLTNGGGKLIFETSSGPAKWIETANSGTAPANIQNQIQAVVQLNSDLEITQDNYQNLNTGTTFTNLINGTSSRTITKKGIGGIQFYYGFALGAGEGFEGQIAIQQGAIRCINLTATISKSSGITVSSGGQLQLADNAAVAVPDYNIGSGAVLNLNGVGTTASSSGPEGALRFGVQATRTTTFHNPVVLQTDSVISVGGLNSIGALDQALTGSGGLTKQGDGKLVLSNASDAYLGDTHILSGPTTGISTLSVTNPIFADGRDVYLSATRTALDLNFGGTDTIRNFYIDGVAQLTGTWGTTGSGAAHESALITGSGFLNVAGGVPGDFNGNGVVDAADYVLWRKGGPLQNEVDTPGTVNGQDYLDWRARFGNSSGSGSSLAAAAVPEPATLVLFMLIAPLVAVRKLGRTRSC